MTDYVINFTDPAKTSFVIKPLTTDGPLTPNNTVPLDPQAVSAHTSIILLGQGMFEYGERVAEDLVHMLENFANSTAPVYAIEGQLWFKNTPAKGLFVWDGVSWLPIMVGGLIAADLDMGGFKIINLGNPTVATDALNLGFADARYVNITGDTMLGALTVPGVTISGGSLDAGSFPVINIPAPSAATDAVNRNYVDTRILDDLADVIITAPAPGDILEWNGLNWINSAAAAPTTLAGLADVNIAGPTNGQVLTYNFGILKWENQTPPADRYVTSGSLNSTTGVLTLNFSTATPSPSVTVGGTFAPFNHNQASTTVLHNIYYPASAAPPMPATTLVHSFFRQHLIGDPYPQSQYPGAIVLQQVLALADETLYSQTALPKRSILQGDGATTLFSLEGDYVVGQNKLAVYTNGVKQYASQRFAVLIDLDNLPSHEGADTKLVDGTYTFDIQVDGTLYTGGTAPSITVAEDRSITVVAVTPTNQWTISGNHAPELGPGTYVTVTGNGFGPANTTYKVLSAFNSGPNTVITVDTGDGSPAIPVGATATGTLRKGYYFQQLLEDLDASFVLQSIPARMAFRDSTLKIFSNTIGSTSIVYIPQTADGLFTPATPNGLGGGGGFFPGSFVYTVSTVGIDRADNTVNPDEFGVIGNYTAAFPTGVKFVVYGSTGNDAVYTTVAPATFALGKTTIYVTDGSITTNEAAGSGTGAIYFARDLAFTEVGAFGDTTFDISFLTAPADGALIETISQP